MDIAAPKNGPRIALGSLTFEGNSFSPVLTDIAQFERCYLLAGDEIVEILAGSRDAIAGALAALAGAEVLPLIAADAGAGGRVASHAYQQLKTRMLDRLRASLPVDGVYLALHGAMITEHLDDAEADLIEAVREVVGPSTPIAASCDLHGNITERMARAVDILLGFKLYPHDDAFETGEAACRLLLDAVRGGVRPTISLKKVAALFPVPAQITSDPFPLAEMRAAAVQLERSDQILAVSFFPVHPWLDVPDAGFAAVVVTDDARADGDAAAGQLCELAWERRYAISVPVLTPDQAIEQADVGNGLTLLADVADCVGGGAPGTSAEVIEALLRAAPEAASAAVVCSPDAAAKAAEAGTGAIVEITLGEEGYGPVVRAQARVERLIDGRFHYAAGPLGGVEANLGPSATLRIGNLRVLATTYPAYEYGDEQFVAGGIDVQRYDFAVVKNPVNARLAIPNAAFVVLDTVGPTSPRLKDMPWRRLARPCFPMDDAQEPLWRVRPDHS